MPTRTTPNEATRPVQHWTQLGLAVRDARAAAGLTQAQLAERAGVSRAWLARVEGGHRKAELEQVLRVLSALDLTLAVMPAPPPALSPGLAEALRLAGLQ